MTTNSPLSRRSFLQTAAGTAAAAAAIGWIPAALPAGVTRFRGNAGAAARDERFDRGYRERGFRHVRHEAPVGTEEQQLAVVATLQSESALVHQGVVKPAQQDQVVHVRMPAVGPVADVVRVHVTVVEAARKAAALVTELQCAARGRRNAARTAADIERGVARQRAHRHDGRIAGESSRRLRRERAAVLDVAALGAAVVGQRLLEIG